MAVASCSSDYSARSMSATENCLCSWTFADFDIRKRKRKSLLFESEDFSSENGKLKWILRARQTDFRHLYAMSIDLILVKNSTVFEHIDYEFHIRNAANDYHFEQPQKRLSLGLRNSETLSTIFKGTHHNLLLNSRKRFKITLEVQIKAHLCNSDSFGDIPNVISDVRQEQRDGISSSSLLRKRRDKLHNMYLEKNFTDVTLVIGDKEIAAHRVILAAESHVFESLLQNAMNEGNTSLIEITDFKFETINELVHFIYTMKTPNFENCKVERVLSVLEAAHKFAVEELLTPMVNFLISNVNAENVMDILLVADRHNLSNLKEVAFEFICANKANFSSSGMYTSLLQKPTLMAEVLAKLCNC